MDKLFNFDVTLKDLMNLSDRAKDVQKLGMLFVLLEKFWYSLDDKEKESERWNNVRVGSVNVFLDEGNQLHLEFITRFHFDNSPEFLKVLNHFKDEK